MLQVQFTDWPQELEFVIGTMTESSGQLFKEFQPDKGAPMRRATTSPAMILAGEATMNETQWQFLKDLWVHHRLDTVFKVKNRGSTGCKHYLIGNEPIVKRSKTVGNQPTSLDVYMTLTEIAHLRDVEDPNKL